MVEGTGNAYSIRQLREYYDRINHTRTDVETIDALCDFANRALCAVEFLAFKIEQLENNQNA